jgi:hypothetical protein
MYVGQDTIDINGVEHKPLKLTGEPDKVEVKSTIRNELILGNDRCSSSALNSMYSIHYRNRARPMAAIVSIRIHLDQHRTMIMAHEFVIKLNEHRTIDNCH